MTPDDIRKLLGGYATGTLTETEREALFAAALEDQDLFDELAREQPVRDLLRDPGARAEMLAALDPRPHAWSWWWRPAAAVAVAGLAVVAVLVIRPKPRPPLPAPPIVATVRAPEPVVIPPPSAKPAATPAPAKQRKTLSPLAASPAEPPPADAAANLAEAPKVETAPPRPAGVVGGVIGGVPGGVIGGIVRSAPPTALEALRADSQPAARAFTAPESQPSARSLFYGSHAEPVRVRAAVTATTGTTQNLGLRYSILRKQGDEFVEADPGGITKSDTLALRFTPNANGYLSIAGGAPVALTAMEPYTTPPLAPNVDEVRVVFGRTPQTAAVTPAAVSTETAGREVFIVNTLAAPALGFTVALKRK